MFGNKRAKTNHSFEEEPDRLRESRPVNALWKFRVDLNWILLKD